MRVGVVFEYPSLNGGEKSMLAVLHYLARAKSLDNSPGIDLEVVAIAPPNGRLMMELDGVVPVVRWEPRTPEGQRKAIPELAQCLSHLASQRSLDVLHANSLSMARITGFLKRTGMSSPSLKATGHVRDIIKLKTGGVNDLNGNDRLVAVSSATRHSLLTQGVDDARCRMIYNGIHVDRDYRIDPASTTALRQSLGIPHDAFLILNVGQLCLRKGQHDLAHAVVGLLREFPNLHVVHLGERYSTKSESVAYAEQFRKIFETAGFPDRLHLAGFSFEVFDWMNTADLLVHTAKQEPFGRALLEAAACGLPIVATNVGGTSEMLRSEIDAELVPAGDLSAIQRGIRRLIIDPQLREARATNARNRVFERFTIAQAAMRLTEFWGETQVSNETQM